MELFEALENAPTTRRFREDPVPREVLLRALSAARWAPSGGNRQPWRVVAVEDRATRKALHELYQPHWEAYLERTGGAALLRAGARGKARVRAVEAADAFARTLERVPLHLVVFADIRQIAFVDDGLERPLLVGGASIYPFVQNLLLAFRGQGLGAALTTLLAPAEREVKELLGVEAGLALAAYVLVGYRADPWPRRLSRLPVERFAFAERYGRPIGGVEG